MLTPICIVGFLLGLVLLLWLRRWSGKRYEITKSDALIAIIPVLIGLVAAGRIDRMKFGPDGFELAVQEAMSEPAVHEVAADRVPIDEVASAPRGQTSFPKTEERVDTLIKQRVRAVVFRMGKGHSAAMIQVYFKRLLPEPFFRFIVIDDEDANYFGLIEAQSVMGILAQQQSDVREADSFAGRFASLLNTGDRIGLQSIPGFISGSIDAKTNKLTALKLLNKENAPYLPVVKEHQFVGIADRSRIVASVLVDMADGLVEHDAEK
jgi:hypothetical protein